MKSHDFKNNLDSIYILRGLDFSIIYFIFILIVIYYYLLLNWNYQYIIS
jgi:hypothetical protein